VAVIEDRDRGLVFGMVQGALGFVTLHHGHGLRPQGGAVALQLGDHVGHVGAGVLQDRRAQVAGVGDAVVDRQPAAPGMAEQVDLAQVQRPAQGLDLLDVAPDGPQARVVGLVRGAAAELVVGHHPVAALDQRQVRIAQVVAGQPGTAVEQEHHPIAGSVAVAHDFVAVDGDPPRLVLLIPVVFEDIPWRGAADRGGWLRGRDSG